MTDQEKIENCIQKSEEIIRNWKNKDISTSDAMYNLTFQFSKIKPKRNNLIVDCTSYKRIN